MAKNIVMPTLGLTMTEGTIETLYFNEGDAINTGDVIAEISSEKLSSPVESPVSGTILKINVQEGDVLPIKEVIAIVGEEGEEVASDEQDKDVPDVPEEASEEVSSASTKEETSSKPRNQGSDGERIFATPLARKMAEEKGIDLSDVNGTGGNHRITRLDIDRYVPSEKVVSSVQSKETATWGIGLSGMRKTIAQRMMESVQTTAQVTNHRKVDITNLMAFRKEIKEKVSRPLNKGELSINTLVTRAVILALQENRELNAWYHNGIHEVQEAIHIGMATDIEEGLVVPVIREADQMTLSQLGSTIASVASQARNGSLPGDLYSGSTFTITNLGGANIEYFTPIINLPEVAILGVGTLSDELALDTEGTVTVHQKLPLSLTYDHQIIDGAPASRFLETVSEYLNDPYRLML